MGDPVTIFREGEAYRREAIKSIWPELYAALMPAGPRRQWGCALAPHLRGAEPREYVPVAGRIWLNGPPACASCLARSSDRPGGYPLDMIENPREWRHDHK